MEDGRHPSAAKDRRRCVVYGAWPRGRHNDRQRATGVVGGCVGTTGVMAKGGCGRAGDGTGRAVVWGTTLLYGSGGLVPRTRRKASAQWLDGRRGEKAESSLSICN